MYMLLHLLFLGLSVFSSLGLAATVPQGTSLITLANPPSTNTSLNATSNSAFVCNKRGTSRLVEPGLSDCAGALFSLPMNPTIGTFYNTGRGDFQLPQFGTYKTCVVLVELRSAMDKFQSSWLAIHQAATGLNLACDDTRHLSGFLSGYTYMDDLKSLKITLQPSYKSLGGGDDATDANATS